MPLRLWLLFLSSIAGLFVHVMSDKASGQSQPLGGLVAETEPLSAEEQRTKFHLPPGFEIQLVASEPEIRKPINLAFDAQGRLYATESVEYPYAAAERAPHRDVVKRFDQFGPDGRAGRAETVVDGLNIPIGLLPLPDGMLVYSIPNIYRLRREGTDGPVSKRDAIFGPFEYRDTHGMCSSFRRWIDGWIYACHGFANTSTVKGSDGQAITMNSGNTYRLKPDGSHIEYFTHGQVNPFGLAFDPLGNLYSADCHSMPIYMLLREAYYPSFGKPDDGLGFGPSMIKHQHGSTGIAGVVYYAAQGFPRELCDTVFIGNPVTGRINHDRLEPHGATYEAIEQPDFITCDDPWFRPVDIRLGTDGALYIADFYNRIIGHYEVPLTHPGRDRERGRIWRVVYTGPDGKASAHPSLVNFSAASAGDLVALLASENLETRTFATHELVDRIGQGAVAPLGKALASNIAPARAHAMWALERLGALPDQQLVTLLDDRDRLVRVHALKLLAERPSWSSEGVDLAVKVVSKLSDPDAFVRRAAADALGRHPAPSHLPKLLDLWTATVPDDTHLVHVTRIAARDHLMAPGMYAALAPDVASNPTHRRQIAELSLGVPTPAAAAYLLTSLKAGVATPGEYGTWLHHTARYASADLRTRIDAFAAALRDKDPAVQVAVVRALYQAAQQRGESVSSDIQSWTDELAASLLTSDDEGRVRDGIELGRGLRLQSTFGQLQRLADDGAPFDGLRDAAIGACVAVNGQGSVDLLARILRSGNGPVPLRQRAARELAAIGGASAFSALSEVLITAPEPVAMAIGQGLSANDQGAERLLDAIESGKASPSLLQEPLISRLLAGRGIQGLQERVAELTASLPPADQRLARLIDERREHFLKGKPNADAGRLVFDKVCAACHRLDGRGAKIGPELDGIGIRGLDRVLEDVLNPSRNVDQAFRTTAIVTDDGRSITGLALRDEGDVLILADSQGKEVRIAAEEIDEKTVSPVSPMSANVLDLVGVDEFDHLLAYLLSQRQKPAGP